MTPKIIKLLEENTGEKLHKTGFGSDSLDVTTMAQATTEKLHKLDFMKILKNCASKDIISYFICQGKKKTFKTILSK